MCFQLHHLIHIWRCRRAHLAGVRDERAARDLRYAALKAVVGP